MPSETTTAASDVRQLLPMDDDLGPQIDWALLATLLNSTGAKNGLSLMHLAGLIGVANTSIQAFVRGTSVPSLRIRYRAAWMIKRLGIDPEHKIISGNDGLVNYAPRSHNASNGDGHQ